MGLRLPDCAHLEDLAAASPAYALQLCVADAAHIDRMCILLGTCLLRPWLLCLLLRLLLCLLLLCLLLLCLLLLCLLLLCLLLLYRAR
jgi:hypothetical protein